MPPAIAHKRLLVINDGAVGYFTDSVNARVSEPEKEEVAKTPRIMASQGRHFEFYYSEAVCNSISSPKNHSIPNRSSPGIISPRLNYSKRVPPD